MTTGTTTTLRPSGIGRYFSAAFLSVWLAGWVMGEAFALAMLGGILSSLVGLFPDQVPNWGADLVASGGAAFAVLFLVIWLTFWTIGGVAALTHLTRSLVGRDVVSLTATGFEVVHRAGPLRRRYTFDRAAIRRLRMRPRDHAVVVDTEKKGPRVVTTFGPPAEREALADWLKRHLVLSDASGGIPPPTWDVRTEGDAICLRKVKPGARSIRSAVAWTLTALTAFAWYSSIDADAGSVPALVLTVFLAAGAAMSTWGRREWIVRPGELTFHRSFALWTSERTFRNATLDVKHETDSDNDSHYKLIVADADGHKTVHSQVHDSGEVDDLARWLAGRTGFRLT